MSVSAKKSPCQSRHLLQEGGLFQGQKLGSCLTLGNELSKETHVLTKQEILLGKGTWVESRRVREPRRTGLCFSAVGVMGWIPDRELRSHKPQGVPPPQKEEEIYGIDMAIKNYKYMGRP